MEGRMSPHVSVAVVLLGFAGSVLAAEPDIEPAEAPCAVVPRPERWQDAGTPDSGRDPPFYTVHRGGTQLAPQQTVWAYRHTLAYEPPMIEADVRQTADHRFVSFHDAEVSDKTDGEGRIEDLSFEQVRALNYADYAPWKGSIYDPAQIVALEEVFELAQQAGVGIELDMKFMLDSQPDADLPAFATVVNRYPEVLRRSIISVPPPVAQAARALIPEGRFMYNLNLLAEEPAEALYPLTELASVFGGKASVYSAEKIAAIHDGCSLTVPHSYDEGIEDEAAQMLLLRAMGSDGFQTNQADLARALFVGPVQTALIPGAAADSVCLVNARNGFGLTRKRLQLREGLTGIGEVETAKGGCAALPQALSTLGIVFAGDASAAAAQLTPPLPAPTVALVADATSVLGGDEVLLSWTSQNADACSAQGAWTGAKPLSGSERVPVGTRAATLSYRLNCTGGGGAASDAVEVEVALPPAPTVSLSASADSVLAGEIVTLSWQSERAVSCQAGGHWSGPRPVTGSETVAVGSAAGTRSYVMSCRDDNDQTVENEARVEVKPVPSQARSGGGSGSWTMLGPLLMSAFMRIFSRRARRHSCQTRETPRLCRGGKQEFDVY